MKDAICHGDTSRDAALVEALRARAPGAADALFERYGTYVERLVVRVLGRDGDAGDLINEAFARILENVGSLRDGAALKGWVGSIAIFTARAFLRDRRSRGRWLRFLAPDDLPEHEAPVAQPEVRQALKQAYAALQALPAPERTAFSLRYIEGHQLVEIAAMCHVSLATVKRRISRTAQLRAPAQREVYDP